MALNIPFVYKPTKEPTMLTDTQLEAKLLLINATDAQIAAAQDRHAIKVCLVNAAIELGMPVDVFDSKTGETTLRDTIGKVNVLTLPPDFVRPTITPADLPDDMRERLERGVVPTDEDAASRRLLDYLNSQGHIEYFSACRGVWRPTSRTMPARDSYHQWRLKPTTPTCSTCGKPKSCGCGSDKPEPRWREPVVPADPLSIFSDEFANVMRPLLGERQFFFMEKAVLIHARHAKWCEAGRTGRIDAVSTERTAMEYFDHLVKPFVKEES